MLVSDTLWRDSIETRPQIAATPIFKLNRSHPARRVRAKHRYRPCRQLRRAQRLCHLRRKIVRIAIAASAQSNRLRLDHDFIVAAKPFRGYDFPAMKLLISEARIRRRVAELAREIEHEFGQGELTVVSVLNGSLMFTADLVRQLSMPLRLDYVGLSLYDGRRKPSRAAVRVERLLRLDVRGHNVLILDDILDSGLTLAKIRSLIAAQRPHTIKTCVLLEKDVSRKIPSRADFVGFRVPDRFVVGYGLDYRERYRNLPYIGILK